MGKTHAWLVRQGRLEACRARGDWFTRTSSLSIRQGTCVVGSLPSKGTGRRRGSLDDFWAGGPIMTAQLAWGVYRRLPGHLRSSRSGAGPTSRAKRIQHSRIVLLTPWFLSHLLLGVVRKPIPPPTPRLADATARPVLPSQVSCPPSCSCLASRLLALTGPIPSHPGQSHLPPIHQPRLLISALLSLVNRCPHSWT